MKLDMIQRFTLVWLGLSLAFGIVAFLISLFIGWLKS